MENNEVKNENATEEKKTESGKAEKEFNGAKWRYITIALTAFLIFAATLFFVVTYFQDDSGRSLIEYIEQGIVVVAALISGCVSIISMINGKENGIEQQEREDRMRKEQQAHEEKLIEQQQEFEEKWNQKKIDADLKARARIEWIQRVREATTAFISSGYSMIRIIDKLDTGKIRECYEVINEKCELLKLYFGPDESGDNDKIVSTIEKIKLDSELLFKDYVNSETTKKIQKLDEKIKGIIVPQIQISMPMYFDDPNEEILVDWDDEDSEEYKKKRRLQEERFRLIDELNDNKEKLVNEISELSETVRKYLKIEWDRAKDNKD